jgi:hypothetical protein
VSDGQAVGGTGGAESTEARWSQMRGRRGRGTAKLAGERSWVSQRMRKIKHGERLRALSTPPHRSFFFAGRGGLG